MILSVIIPIYKAEPFIARCLDSVYEQGVEDSMFEIVAVNDGTTDKSMQIVDDYAKTHLNLKVLNKENGGVSSARNMGVEAASGKYVLFLDADDELIGGSLKKVIYYLISHESMDMLVTRQTRYNGIKEMVVSAPSLVEHQCYNGLEAYRSHYVRMNAGGAICNTAFLRKNNLRFPEGVRNGEDSVFFGLVQVYADSIVYYNLTLYRINEMNESASRSDFSSVGRRFAHTLNELIPIRKSISEKKPEYRGIIDYVVYQLLSNAIFNFTHSKDLKYSELIKTVDIDSLLPLDTNKMYRMRKQARLMNFSFPLYYFLYWIKSCYKDEPAR